MKRMLVIQLFFLIVNLNADNFKVDKTVTKIGFSIGNLIFSKVEGNFSVFDSSFDYDVNTSQLKDIKAFIQVESIDTEDKKRDDHLRSADFFDVAKYPNLTFTSTEMITISPGETKNLRGKLTIKNITKDVVLKVTYKGNVKDPMGNERIVFDAETKIDRRDFDITYGPRFVIGNEVYIKINGEALIMNQMKK